MTPTLTMNSGRINLTGNEALDLYTLLDFSRTGALDLGALIEAVSEAIDTGADGSIVTVAVRQPVVETVRDEDERYSLAAGK